MLISSPEDYGLTREQTLALIVDDEPPDGFDAFWRRFGEEIAATPSRWHGTVEAGAGDVWIPSLRAVRVVGRLTLPEPGPRGLVIRLPGVDPPEGFADDASGGFLARGLGTLDLRVRGFPPSTIDVDDLRDGWITHDIDDAETWIVRGAVGDVVQAFRCARRHFGDAMPIAIEATGLGAGLAIIASAQLARRAEAVDDTGATDAADAADATGATAATGAADANDAAGATDAADAAGATNATYAADAADTADTADAADAADADNAPHAAGSAHVPSRLAIAHPDLGAWRWRAGRYCNGAGRRVNAYLVALRDEGPRLMRGLERFDASLHARAVASPTLCKLAARDDVVPAPAAAAVFNGLAEATRRCFVTAFGHYDGGLSDARRHACFEQVIPRFLDPNEDPDAVAVSLPS